MSAVIRSADETRALSSRIHSLQLSNHLDDTHATLSATALQLCSVDRTRAVTLTHTYIIPDHTVNYRTWFRAMVTRTCSVQSALQHACRVLFLVNVQRVYDTARSFYADLEVQPVRKNSLRRGQSKRSSRGELSNVEAAGTVTSRRQHLPVRREVPPEEVRCLRPSPAVHSRPLPAAVRAVCPLSALLTLCIAVVWQ